MSIQPPRGTPILDTLYHLERLGDLAADVPVDGKLHRLLSERAVVLCKRNGFENASDFLAAAHEDADVLAANRSPIMLTSPVARLSLIGA